MNFDEAIETALENHKAGNLRQAELIYRSILKELPDDIDALHLLGVLFHQMGDYDSAIRYIKKALKVDPGFAEAYNSLGNVVRSRGLIDEAETYYQKALQIDPNLAIAYNNLGNIYSEKNLFDKAIFYLRKALQINPNFAEANSNLAKVLDEIEHFDEAITYCRKAIQINPNYAEAYYNLGTILLHKAQLSEAQTCYQKALERKPLFAAVFNNLGEAFKDKGQQNEAEQCYKRALQLKHEQPVYSNLLFIMNYNSSHNPQRIFSEHLLFAKQFAEPLFSELPSYTNAPVPTRQLKIGYVSPDFRKHAVAYFSEPAIAAHNREHFEVFCYSNSLKHDEVTKRFQEHADQWRNIVGMSDEEVAALIRKDRVDILIDLAGHTANNRMLVFARKPVPIQISWLGYLATTGLSTMDYKIGDYYTDPPGKTEQFYTEKLLRLPESFLCYLPDKDSPDVEPLPALSKGHITFGSFNNFAKVTSEVFTLWANILNELPDARLILKGKSFHDKSTCNYAINVFTRKGVSAERVILQSSDPAPKHLESYNLVDIGLDTFPFNGAATTCEALWMGAPVITVAGTAYYSRVGVSLLSNVGLSELVAKTYDEYISMAVDLANDLKKLQSLRESLRDMMRRSPLCDAKRFTENLEMSYRQIWATWCTSV